jgi:anti-sigma-K factor RskA
MFVKSLSQSFTHRRRAAAVLCLVALMALGTSSSAATPEKDQPVVFTVDVAEDHAAGARLVLRDGRAHLPGRDNHR